MSRIKPPKIDKRQFSNLLDRLKQIAPHYVPEWEILETTEGEKKPGTALQKIFSYIAGTVINRLNQVPDRQMAAFLDMLGIELLPAQPARVPLHFKLSKGAEKEVLIPARTLTAAGKTDEHDELPFETIANLLAVPSPLKKVISIDPGEDAIYLPPPGFLEGNAQGENTFTYTIVSSPDTFSKNFQLDHVTGLEEGDFLKIGTGNNTEYVIISAVKGNIIFITHRLVNSFPAGTPVEKLSAFSLFEGKNMQEHSIYIAHKDLFNVKNQAHFSIDITHRPGTMTGLELLQLSWEYWGEKQGEKGEDWHSFNVIDQTMGMITNGETQLTKVNEGEIKEKEINGINSRWIRCQVKEPLPVNHPRKLPVLDNIVFSVRSSGQNLVPDQAFIDEIPIDLTQPFHPFGKEPRMFETFSIGGKEIFSKKGAEVTLDVKIEQRGIAGPPAAISFTDSNGKEKIKVFARGTYGRLMEVEIDPDGIQEPVWTDHGFPIDTTIASGSTPSVNNIKNEAISVLIRAENGHLMERLYHDNKWQWNDHGTPGEGISFQFDPGALLKFDEKQNYFSVLIVDTNGNLYEFYRGGEKEKIFERWVEHKKPKDTAIASSPCVIENNEGSQPLIFVQGNDGKLYGLSFTPGNTNKEEDWIDCGSPSQKKPGVKVDSKPFGFAEDIWQDTIYNIYVKGDDGQLWEYYYHYYNAEVVLEDIKVKEWKELGFPDGKYVDSAPHGIIGKQDGSLKYYIFVRGSDDCLWEITDTLPWQKNPGYSLLLYTPYVLPIKIYQEADNEAGKTEVGIVLHVFSATSQNSIVERRIALYNKDGRREETWKEYKDPNETALTPTLSWEYWNGKGWGGIQGLKDETANLLKSGKITFKLAENIEEIEVAGQKNYWVRARIVGGDYGKETHSLSLKYDYKEYGSEEQKLISTKDTIRPPVINSLFISYTLETKQFPEQCLTYNNLEYRLRTEECKTEDKHFTPFVKLHNKTKTLYLGFEKFFKGGPLKIFFDALELPYTENQKPKLEWNLSKKSEWEEISGFDFTESLIKAGILEFLGPTDFSAQSIFGQYLYWLKGSLVKGAYEEMPRLQGIYPNTTWALQVQTFENEILGSGSGQANQTFTFLNKPVQKGQEVRVREVIPGEEKQTLIKNNGNDAIKEVTDKDGNVIETWVLWTEVPDFYDSTDKDRHYTFDPAVGLIRFGDGNNGMSPPAGENNIKAISYQSGGSYAGNVKKGEITTLKSAVAGVDSVVNPAAADGGADTATLDQMMEIGPAQISHRNRTVTPEDFEWLAKQASRKIVKTRCLPNTNNKKVKETGWVTVIIVPDSPDPQPFPSLELRGIVKKHLETYSDLGLSAARHIHVDGPKYSIIDVSAQVFVTSLDVVSQVERTMRKKLDAFFHPLTGGPEGKGWDFGRSVTASDVYALLESIEGVDYVEKIAFNLDGEPVEHDILKINDDVLAANGTHTIDINIDMQRKKGE